MIGDSSLGRGWEFSSSLPRPDWVWGPPSLLSSGYQGALSLRVKQSGHEGDNARPSSVEVRNAWSYTSTPQYAFMAWWSVKKSTGTTLPLPYLTIHPSIHTHTHTHRKVLNMHITRQPCLRSISNWRYALDHLCITIKHMHFSVHPIMRSNSRIASFKQIVR
jgi:hypothetical protein